MKTIISVAVFLSLFSLCGADTMEYKLQALSEKFDVPIETATSIIKCESGFKPYAVGDSGTSYGLVQIHLPAHPYVSKQQALDENYSLWFLFSNISKGKIGMWSCAKMLGLTYIPTSDG